MKTLPKNRKKDSIPISFDKAAVTQKPNQMRTVQGQKTYAAFTHEQRCETPKQNFSKSNPIVYLIITTTVTKVSLIQKI